MPFVHSCVYIPRQNYFKCGGQGPGCYFFRMDGVTLTGCEHWAMGACCSKRAQAVALESWEHDQKAKRAACLGGKNPT